MKSCEYCGVELGVRNLRFCSRKCRSSKHGEANTGKKTVEYNAWRSMIERCKPNNSDHKHYFDRGIKVCERWIHSFENFLSDVKRKPTPQHSLDRWPDPNGNYEPNNVRWATKRQQAHNRHDTIKVEFEGEMIPVAELRERHGIARETTRERIKHGWSVLKACTIPVGQVPFGPKSPEQRKELA